jgi:hypothetical protein
MRDYAEDMRIRGGPRFVSGAAMRRFGRWLGVGLVVTTATVGCSFGKKPYAADPLLTHRHGTWGDWEKVAEPDTVSPEPDAPAPPPGPLLGSPLLAVTSPP